MAVTDAAVEGVWLSPTPDRPAGSAMATRKRFYISEQLELHLRHLEGDQKAYSVYVFISSRLGKQVIQW